MTTKSAHRLAVIAVVSLLTSLVVPTAVADPNEGQLPNARYQDVSLCGDARSAIVCLTRGDLSSGGPVPW